MLSQAIRNPRQEFADLVGGALVCAVFGAILLSLTPRVVPAAADVGFVWLIAILLHARSSLAWIEQAVDYLHLDCPACSHSFHGYPDRLPRPSRTRCAHCGTELPGAF